MYSPKLFGMKFSFPQMSKYSIVAMVVPFVMFHKATRKYYERRDESVINRMKRTPEDQFAFVDGNLNHTKNRKERKVSQWMMYKNDFENQKRVRRAWYTDGYERTAEEEQAEIRELEEKYPGAFLPYDQAIIHQRTPLPRGYGEGGFMQRVKENMVPYPRTLEIKREGWQVPGVDLLHFCGNEDNPPPTNEKGPFYCWMRMNARARSGYADSVKRYKQHISTNASNNVTETIIR
eukprot:134649_1